MSDLTYRRIADARPPVRDQVVLDGGALTTWLSIGAEVGRFAGRAEDASRLVTSLSAALAAPRPPQIGRVPPDAMVEVVLAGGLELRFAAGEALDGAWGALLGACRATLDHPGAAVAAIGLVAEAPGRLRLEHRGTELLRLGFGAVVAEVVAYRDGTQAGATQTRLADGVVDALPGWFHTFELDPVDATGVSLVASVSFAADDGGVWVPVRCEVTATG